MDGGGEFADITNNPRKRKRNEKEWAKKQTKEEKNSSAGKCSPTYSFVCVCVCAGAILYCNTNSLTTNCVCM